MTIYNEISSNKIRTYVILLVFIALITGFFYIVGKYYQDPFTYFSIGLTFSLISAIGSYFYSDKIVLMISGAHPADKKRYFDLYTVTENLSIASGLPIPKVYVIDDQAPNAFATGRNPKHAVVCATTGLLEKLDRSELEGVIAHELSHVKNYDILLSTIVVVLVGTVATAANWITRSMWWGGGSANRRSDDNRNNRGNTMFFILFIFSLIFIPIIATLIQLAISRKREFLADASGTLLTRYPEGLARALEKISSDRHVLQNASPSTAHLFIVNPFKKQAGITNWLNNLFSTHPPIEERIRILRMM